MAKDWGVGAKRGSEMSLRVLLCAKISGHDTGELAGEVVSEWGPSFSQDRPGFVVIKTIPEFQHSRSVLLLYSFI